MLHRFPLPQSVPNINMTEQSMLMADFEQQAVQAPLLQMFQYKQIEVEDQDLEDSVPQLHQSDDTEDHSSGAST